MQHHLFTRYPWGGASNLIQKLFGPTVSFTITLCPPPPPGGLRPKVSWGGGG